MFVSACSQKASLVCPDITVGHQHHDTDAVAVQQFVTGISHALEQRGDIVALGNMKKLLDGLGLVSSVCPSPEAAIAFAVTVNPPEEQLSEGPIDDDDGLSCLGTSLLQVCYLPARCYLLRCDTFHPVKVLDLEPLMPCHHTLWGNV